MATKKVSELTELELIAPDDYLLIVDESADTTKRVLLDSLFMPCYVVDQVETNQGAACSGRSVKDLVDSIGATRQATIVFTHHDEGANTTTSYAFGTSETITSNITVVVQHGAILTLAGGITLTIQGPVQAGAYQIDGGTGTLTISSYPQDQAWWGNTQRNDFSLVDITEAQIDTLNVDNCLVDVGGSTGTGEPIVVVEADITAVANVGAGPEDLMTYTLPANAFDAAGQVVRVTAFGITAANANNKTVTLTFGTDTIITAGPTAANDKDWILRVLIMRTGVGTFTAFGEVNWNGAGYTVPTWSTPAEVETAAIIIKIIGQGAAGDDIIQKGFLIEFMNN